jgi:ubiquinone biosynthesis protein
MKITSIPQFARNAGRATEVLTILSKYGLADWISRMNIRFIKGIFNWGSRTDLANRTTEARIRMAMAELGTTFIKLGQVLSTRADLVGGALAAELTKLQANVPADPVAVVRSTIQQELGSPVEDLFADFDDVPMASASIAQVHRAKLKDGTPIVVKVQHPRIAERIRNDLDILAGLAELAEKYIEEIRPYQPRAVVKEFERTLLRELDFGREQRNLKRFLEFFANDKTVRFPKPYPELSTGKVLVMDLLEGRTVAEIEKAGVGGEGEQIAKHGARVFLEMIFRDGFYHADPHPGNLLILPDGVIGILDVGMVGQLTPNLREDMEDLLLAIGTNNPDQLVATLMRLCGPTGVREPSGFAADVADFVGYYQGQSLNRIDISNALTEITQIIRGHQLIMPTSFAMLLRVLIVLEGTSRLLHPQFKLAEVIEPFQERMVAERVSPIRQLRRLRSAVVDWQDLVAKLPNQLRDMMQKAQTGRVELQLEHHHLEPSVNRFVLALITAALFLASSILWGLKAPPTILDVSVIGVLGFMASIANSALLIRSIWRSGYFDG